MLAELTYMQTNKYTNEKKKVCAGFQMSAVNIKSLQNLTAFSLWVISISHIIFSNLYALYSEVKFKLVEYIV